MALAMARKRSYVLTGKNRNCQLLTVVEQFWVHASTLGFRGIHMLGHPRLPTFPGAVSQLRATHVGRSLGRFLSVSETVSS